MRNISHVNDTLLAQSQKEVFTHLLPVIVCMAVVGVVGILGNIFAFIFYAFKVKRTACTVQIACLSAVDFLVCVMIIPNIVEMAVNVKYDQPFLCKLTHFLGLWTIGSSCFILWLIALDRHRKICKPFAKQMTVKSTVRAIVGLLVLVFLLSVRNFAIFDCIEIDVQISGSNETVRGRYCTTRADSGYKLSVSIFHGVDFLISLMIWLTVIVTYTHVLCTLFRMRRTFSQDKKASGENDARSATERNITYMMLTVSLVFVLCFFPYYVIKVVMRLALKAGEEFEMAVGAQFALRLVYFNSVFNPVVYCFFNPQFRHYLNNLLFRCFRCGKDNYCDTQHETQSSLV
ncbi:neuropeptide CCHamide-2 receptor-like isoform X2 [Mercenaria mercenaria]|nr:neuropeptide CCHamide-2 receptor-like isoform X2 [Mercenaria mercenaria]XP_053407424.1 neuropeptide CCHamide-2 receptor-like isoform X2 [Mercenaria mercenaria]